MHRVQPLHSRVATVEKWVHAYVKAHIQTFTAVLLEIARPWATHRCPLLNLHRTRGRT